MRRGALSRDGVALAFTETGSGAPPPVLVHCWCGDHTHLTPQSSTSVAPIASSLWICAAMAPAISRSSPSQTSRCCSQADRVTCRGSDGNRPAGVRECPAQCGPQRGHCQRTPARPSCTRGRSGSRLPGRALKVIPSRRQACPHAGMTPPALLRGFVGLGNSALDDAARPPDGYLE